MINLTINGTTHAVDADPDMPLLWMQLLVRVQGM